MTDKGEERALLSRIDMFVTRSEFAAERIKSSQPGSTAAAVANDMLVASHLVKQLVEHLPPAELVIRCLVAGFREVAAECEAAQRQGLPETHRLLAQAQQLEVAVSRLPGIVAMLTAPPAPEDSVSLIAGLAPVQSSSLQ